MHLPKFSVITVSYNQGEFIRDTIESVLAQNYPNFEHIIIDAGSTDNTIEILKEYPHLNWVSEPDRGQSHGLNKGIAKATGDVIAWLNSDDYYAPDAFHTVAKQIVEYPVVMGRCAFVDRGGKLTEEVDNLERGWMDTLKYWVFHSSPAQPSIFFTRACLAELGIPYDGVLDETLNFAMDYDLWLRLQERYPFVRRVDKVLSNFRNYETNKTGADMASTYREASRVYRRHVSRRIGQEQNFSYVLPVGQSCRAIERFVASLAVNRWGPIEVVVSDYADRATSRTIKKEVRELGARYQHISFQHVRVPDELPRKEVCAIDCGIAAARSPIVACLDVSRQVTSDFTAKMQSIFLQDNLAVLFPSLDDKKKTQLFTPKNGALYFNPTGPLTSRVGSPEFVIRKIAAVDAGGLRLSEIIADADDYPMKRLLMMLLHKAWLITAMDVLPQMERPESTVLPEAFRVYANSLVLEEMAKELEMSAFARLRVANGFGVSLPPELEQVARNVVANVPGEFRLLTGERSEEELGKIASQYPSFGPASYMLSLKLEQAGRIEDARKWRSKWESAYAVEQSSPLYGAQP